VFRKSEFFLLAAGQPGGRRERNRCTAVLPVVAGRQVVSVSFMWPEVAPRAKRKAASGPGKNTEPAPAS